MNVYKIIIDHYDRRFPPPRFILAESFSDAEELFLKKEDWLRIYSMELIIKDIQLRKPNDNKK